ncbi:Uncharacterized protein PCOAH_00028180 [Plasmodium coatneyi]|uniref:Pv-fam-d protein n=1 Tax=Plasmodium coatneyi TaxID=208452 RepID=A0A1B1DZR5_9APIC|nr:Uncharacterized protein PCOAH_00028180 [Plasmodium coatneyi]ANQ08273.1 Uncharacterized protein PCOAH_00028180 [Plasmodium coatneyi]
MVATLLHPFNFNKSLDTTCHPKNARTVQLGRILTGGTTTVQSPPMYTNLKEKQMDTLDKGSADVFSKRLHALIQDENFRKQYERLLHGNEFTRIFSDMVIDYENLKKTGVPNVPNGPHFMNNDASSDWEEAIKKISSSSDRKDATGKFTLSNRKKRSRNFDQSDESLNLDNFDDDCAHVDDDLPTFTGSMESLFLKEQQARFPHREEEVDDLSAFTGSENTLFEEKQTTVPHRHHYHHHYDDRDDDMSTNFASVESIFKEPNDGYADNVSTISGSVDTLFKEQSRFSYDDRRVNPSVGTYSCKSEYTGTEYYDSYGNLYHVVDENNEHERAKAKTGVHLPMLDEHPTKEHKYYNSFKNVKKRNSVKEKIYKHIPFLGKFFNKIDAKLESEIRRYLDIKEIEKQNYPVRKVKGTRKFLNFLSKNRVFVPLGVLGIVFSIFLAFLLITEFSGVSSFLFLLSGFIPSAGTITSPVLSVLSYIVPPVATALVCGVYSFLVLYYERKLYKIRRSRKHIKKLSAMRNKDDD